MDATTTIGAENIGEFLCVFAPNISIEDLQPVPTQGGDNLTFYYRDDRILKIAQNEYRERLLREAKIVAYLNTQQVPIAIPQALQFHQQGFYALFSRIDGIPTTVEALEGFSPEELESFTQSLGSFLTFLHRHSFPDDVLGCLPRADDTFPVSLEEARRQIAFIEGHATEVLFEDLRPHIQVDIDQWKERLECIQQALKQRWAVVHCDLQLSHLFCAKGRVGDLAIIDFGDAMLHDPAVDLSEFAIELYSDLNPDGILAKKILDSVIAHYQTGNPAVAEKIEFGLLSYEIGRAVRQVNDR